MEPGGGNTPNTVEAGPRRRAALAVAMLAVFVACGMALAVFADELMIGGAALVEWIRALGPWWGAAAVILLMIVHCFVPFPAEILALCAGAVFGVIEGAALIWVGAMLGAALSFWLARRLGRDAMERLTPPRHRSVLDRWTGDHGAMTLLIARLIPVIAFNLINYAAGLTRVGWWTFLWTTGLGILPITLLTTWLGAEMRDLSWPLLVAVSAGCVAMIWAAHLVARRFGGRG